MNAAALLRQARTDAGLTLRELAARAHTSHSTLAAYESGRTTPTVSTLHRVLEAAGYGVDVTLTPRAARHHSDSGGRGRELAEVLDLAEQFPVRHERRLSYPIFGVA